MKWLLLVVCLASCAPKPAKVYTEVEIGMSSLDFRRICSSPDDSQTTTNTSGSTEVIINHSPDFKGEERPYQCTGRFTFVNGKLDTISR